MIIGSDIQGKRPDLAAVQDQLKIAGRSRSRDPAVVEIFEKSRLTNRLMVYIIKVLEVVFGVFYKD